MNLREVVWGGVDWMHLAQDTNQWRAAVNTGNFMTICMTISFSRSAVIYGVS